jgi:hypothetical protein
MFSSILRFFGFNSKTEKQSQTPTDKQIEDSVKSFLNRPIHKVLTKEIIDKTNDDELEQTIFDNISIRMAGDQRGEFEIVKSLTNGQQMVYSTWAVEGEVNNGGFNQFYFNSSGQFAEMSVIGFRLIGAFKFADLTNEANKIYEENKARLEEFDDGTMESFSASYKDNPLNYLDSKFFELYKDENLKELKTKYIRQNYVEFIQKQ